MAQKDPPPKREKSPFIEDAILRETVRKENMFAKEFSEFQPSLFSLREATPDKPLVKSFCSTPHDEDYEDEQSVKFRSTLHMTSRDTDPRLKYDFPPTTTMEIGWDPEFYQPRKSMFDHRKVKTDITMLPSRWDPNANVMTVKEAKPK